jgi:hypothetical protein
MPAEAIDRIYTLAQQAPLGLIFGDRNNDEVATYQIDDDTGDKEDSDYEPADQDGSSDSDDSNYESSDSGDDDEDDDSDIDESHNNNDKDSDPESDDDDISQDNEAAGVHGSDSNAQSVNRDDTLDDSATAPGTGQDEPGPEPEPPNDNQGRQLRCGKRSNYSDMSTATHLKTVGYNNLVKGVATARRSVTADYANVPPIILTWPPPLQHTTTSQGMIP